MALRICLWLLQAVAVGLAVGTVAGYVVNSRPISKSWRRVGVIAGVALLFVVVDWVINTDDVLAWIVSTFGNWPGKEGVGIRITLAYLIADKLIASSESEKLSDTSNPSTS